MFDADHYVQRMNEAQQRASIAPTDETRLSWQAIQQGWEAIIRIQKDILNGKGKGVSGAPALVPAQEPVSAEPRGATVLHIASRRRVVGR